MIYWLVATSVIENYIVIESACVTLTRLLVVSRVWEYKSNMNQI